jgi:hypothetical protein
MKEKDLAEIERKLKIVCPTKLARAAELKKAGGFDVLTPISKDG